jgi:hypothetical protein
MKIASQIADMAGNETVPNVLVLILQTIYEFQASINDKNLDSLAKQLYLKCQDHPDSDVSYYAKLYAAK